MAKNIVKIPVHDVIVAKNTKTIVNMRVSNKALKETLETAQQKMIKLTENPDLSVQFANALIDSAKKITPYRDEYELKKKLDVDRNGVRKKLKVSQLRFGVTLDKKGNKPESYYGDITKVNKKGKKITRKAYLFRNSNENGERSADYEEQLLRERGNIARVKADIKKNKAHRKRELNRLEKEHKQNLDKVNNLRKNEHYFADRPPHLRDGYSYSYQGGKVGIIYKARKYKDDQFRDNSFRNNSKEALQEYAKLQYTSQDVDWNRFTKGTASRWLEQAVGMDVGPGYKKAAINGKANYKKLIKIFQKGVSDALSNR